MPHHPIRTLQSQDAGLLVVPMVSKSRALSQSLKLSSSCPVALWNQLPTTVQEADTISTFESFY